MKAWGIRIVIALAITAALVTVLSSAQQISLISNAQPLITGMALFFAILVLLRQFALAGTLGKLREQNWDVARYDKEMNQRMTHLVQQAAEAAGERERTVQSAAVYEVRAALKTLQSRIEQIERKGFEASGTPSKPSLAMPNEAGASHLDAPEDLKPFVLSDPASDNPPLRAPSKPQLVNVIKNRLARGRAEMPDTNPSLQSALANNKLDLHLQPVLTMPDRKPIYFEALMRLQTGPKEYLDHDKFYALAEEGGLVPVIETKIIFSAVRMLLSLRGMKKQAGVFCPISKLTLGGAQMFSKLRGFLEDNRSLNRVLVLQLPQRQFARLSEAERERLSQIAELGFSICLSNVDDLNLDPEQLSELGIRFIKTDALLMLYPKTGEANGGMNPANLVAILDDYDISLIVGDVQREGQAIDLIDLDVGLVQGTLFAPPRPVKAELLNAPSPSENSRRHAA